MRNSSQLAALLLACLSATSNLHAQTSKPTSRVAAQPADKQIATCIGQLRDDNPRVRHSAMRKLVRLEKRACAPIVKALEDEVGKTDQPSKESLAYIRRLCTTLEKLGPDAAAATNPLATLYKDAASKMRITLMHTAVTLAPWGENMQRQLMEVFKVSIRNFSGTNPKMFEAEVHEVQRLVFRTNVPIDSTMERLILYVREGQNHVRSFAAELLGRKGAKAKEAIPALLERLANAGDPPKGQRRGSQHPDDFKKQASEALIQIDPRNAKIAVAYANRLAYEQDEDVLRETILTLASFGKKAKPAVPALIQILDDERPMLAGEAATALGTIGLKSETLIARLRRMSQSKNRGLAVRAKAALKALERD